MGPLSEKPSDLGISGLEADEGIDQDTLLSRFNCCSVCEYTVELNGKAETADLDGASVSVSQGEVDG